MATPEGLPPITERDTSSTVDDVDRVIPPTVVMRSMWLHERFADGAGCYNTGAALRFSGSGDLGVLRSAIQTVVDRHDILRVTVRAAGPEPVLVVSDDSRIELEWADAAPVDDDELRSRLDAFVTRPFDLERGPLLRFAAFSRADDDHVVVLAIHHLITDVWSMALLADEIGDEYRRLCDGREPEPVRPSLEYARHAECEGDAIASGRAHHEFWSERFEAMPSSFELPFDRPPGASTSPHGALALRLLDVERVAEIEGIARAAGVRSDEVVLAGLLALLSRYSGRSDTGVVVVKAGRSIRTARTQGCFVNPVPFPMTIGAGDTLVDVAARVGVMNRASVRHERYPALAAIGPGSVRREGSPGPSRDVAFIWHKTARAVDGRGLLAQAVGEFGVRGEMAGRSFETVPLANRPTPYALGVLATPVRDGLALAAEYRTALFDHPTIERLLGHLERLMSAAASSPLTPVSRLQYVHDAEHAPIESPGRGSVPTAPDQSLVATIERRAAEHPDREALICGNRSWTYRELVHSAARLDVSIRTAGLGPGSRIASLLPRSVDLVIAMLATIRSGATFVPADPAASAGHVAQRFRRIGVDGLVCSAPDVDPVARGLGDLTVVGIDDDPAETDFPGPADPADAAVVLTTSGSEGRPADVELSHRALMALLHGVSERTGADDEDRFVWHTAPTFVNSLREILLPLLVGASAVVVDDDAARDPRSLGGEIDRRSVSIVSATPTMLRALLATGWTGPTVRQIWAGGEPLGRALARELCRTGRSVWNTYGSTETPTVAMHRVDPGRVEPAPVPVGTPLRGASLRVLDRHGEPVPLGIEGELCVGGRPIDDLTDAMRSMFSSRLVEDPARSGEQLLRTGDAARARPDGLVEVRGRLDRTVHVRGVRLSLDEVEEALGEHPSVLAAVSSVERGPGRHERLVAQVELAPDDVDTDSSDLRAFLGDRVSPHLVPSVIHVVDVLSRTTSGKTSLAPINAVSVGTADAEPPRGDLEELIAAIFAEVLGRDRLGRHDDFFALGGHSLMAVEAFAQLESRLGQRLQLSMLAAAPTVAELADRIGSLTPTAGSSLVPVNADGARVPFFYVSPYLVTVLSVVNIGAHLPAEQPFFAVQPHGIEDDRPLRSSVEQMASDHLAEIRRVQPRGPYSLGGHCSGSWIAFEMARQLQEAGEQVDNLVLVDIGPPGLGPPPGTRLMQLVERLQHYRRSGRLVDALKWRLGFVWELGVLRLVGRGRVRREAKVRRAHRRAHRSYSPSPIGGGALLVRSEEYDRLDDRAWHLRWDRLLSGPLDVAVVAGTHAGLVENRYASELAAVIEHRLGKAGSSEPSTR